MVDAATRPLIEAESLAARLPALLVEADRVAATVALGVHGRRRSGPGESFWQFRRYQPGDSADLIDWRQSARTDRLYVRETEWMAAQSVWIWADASASMRWRSYKSLPEKRERALVLALALGALLLRGGERVGPLGLGRPPVIGRAGLGRLAAEMMEQPLDLPVVVPSTHGHVILLSDFLMPRTTIEAALRRWSSAGLAGHIVHILDPAEEDLPYEGRMRVRGLEGETEFLAPRIEDLREAYHERLADLKAWLARSALSIGWGFTAHRTEASAAPALLALHAALSEHR